MARATTTAATGQTAGPTQEQILAEIAYLTRALKAPTLPTVSGVWQNGPGPKTGPTNSSWPPACNAR